MSILKYEVALCSDGKLHSRNKLTHNFTCSWWVEVESGQEAQGIAKGLEVLKARDMSCVLPAALESFACGWLFPLQRVCVGSPRSVFRMLFSMRQARVSLAKTGQHVEYILQDGIDDSAFIE